MGLMIRCVDMSKIMGLWGDFMVYLPAFAQIVVWTSLHS